MFNPPEDGFFFFEKIKFFIKVKTDVYSMKININHVLLYESLHDISVRQLFFRQTGVQVVKNVEQVNVVMNQLMISNRNSFLILIF
jgi:hypothetical protein